MAEGVVPRVRVWRTRPTGQGVWDVLGLIGCLMTAVPVGAQTGAAGRAVISGTVRHARTDLAIGGAVVLLQGTLLSAVSDDSGRFRLGNVAPGQYTVRVFAMGYVPDTVSTGVLGPAERRELAFRLRPAPLVLPGVVVTADQGPRQVTETPVSVAILPREELLDRNVTYLEDALAFVPGITFNGGGQLDIRGSTGTAQGVGSRVLMMLDSHPVLSADGGEIIWEALPLLDVQRVEVVKSAYSAIYGSNALGGVVNVITTPIGDQPETVVRAHYGLFQLPGEYRFTTSSLSDQGVQVMHSQRVDGVGTRFEIGREASNGWYENGQYNRWFARAKLTSPDSSAHPWDAYAIWSRNNSGNFLEWQSADHPFQVDSAYRGDYSVYNAVYSGATLAPLVTPTAVLKVSPYLNYNSNQDYFHTDQDYHRAVRGGTSVELTVQQRGGDVLTAGVDGAYSQVTSNFLGTPQITDGGAFAQDEIRLAAPLTVTAGGRVDYHSTTLSEAEASFNPKLALRYALSDKVSLRASVGRGYRAPSAIEQFVRAVEFGYHVIPNPALAGEDAWSSEIGAIVSPWPGTQIDAAVFQSDYHNLIGPTAAPDSVFVFQFRNVQRARVRGLDLDWNNTLIPNLADLSVTYLYLDARDTETGEWLPYRSRDNVTATVNILRGLAGVDIRYRSRVESVLVYPLDTRSDITVVDLRANAPFFGTILQAKIANLFNRFYTDVQERTPGSPRNLSLGVLATF